MIYIFLFLFFFLFLQKPLKSLPSSSSSSLLQNLIVLDTPETPTTFASSTPLATRRRKIEEDEHWSPSPLRKRKSPRHTILPKVQQPQLQPEFSPASEAKLEGFKRALLAKEHVWCSWIDKESGHVKSKGLIDASESLVLPLHLTGDRDIQVKPRFTMIVWPSTPTDAALCQLDDTWGPVQGACS